MNIRKLRHNLFEFMMRHFGYRYSGVPSRQLLWYWLMRDMKLSDGCEVGLDVGSGAMLNRPLFRVRKYVAIDLDGERLNEGLAKYPDAMIINKRLEEVEGITGDFVLCVQVFSNQYMDATLTTTIVKSLVGMVLPDGVLIFNITKRNLPYEIEIDTCVNRFFSQVVKRKYSDIILLDNLIGSLIGTFMYFFPYLRYGKEYTKIYYLCKGRYPNNPVE